jgi:hypothetical protein
MMQSFNMQMSLNHQAYFLLLSNQPLPPVFLPRRPAFIILFKDTGGAHLS